LNIGACVLGVTFFVFFLSAQYSTALGNLLLIREEITNSRPGVETPHTLILQTFNAIPPSGKIVITPENQAFILPAGFDYTDVDFATSSSLTGSFAERAIGATSSASQDGVEVLTGTTTSKITITLNSTFGVGAGTFVKIKFGKNASYETLGDKNPFNPNTSGSYRVRIQTQDSVSNILDVGAAMVAIIDPVRVEAERVDVFPPVRSNGSPTGVLAEKVTAVELTLNTDEIATCRYSTVAGTSYESMTNTFSETKSIFHATAVGGLSCGNAYSFFVRCADLLGNKNMDDFIISFSIKSCTPPPLSSFPAGGAPFSPPPPPPQVSFEGKAQPLANISILRDGKLMETSKADSGANFRTGSIPLPSQGKYTFTLSSIDTENRTSKPVTVTFTIVSGTQNITSILIPPTIEASKTSISAGDILKVSGRTAPGSKVEVWLYPQKKEREAEKVAIKNETAAEDNGFWSMDFDTSGLAKDTYIIKARFAPTAAQISDFGKSLFIGVGMEPRPDFSSRADINKDGRVNLTDFSIMLFHWNTAEEKADINLDGTVNLADFSILLFYWTG
jgi:hypothetical protein